MRVYIGPYIDRFTTRRMDKLWYSFRYGEENYHSGDYEDDVWYEKFSDLIQNIFNFTINRYLDKKKRKVKVKIHGYDIWSADNTLAKIIHPTLLKLKEHKHGAPYVDPEDVPDELKPKEEASEKNQYSDDTHFVRWDWILDEMIWTFEQLADETGGEDKFCKVKENHTGSVMDSFEWDMDGLKAHEDRIKRGTILFGKYFRALWD